MRRPGSFTGPAEAIEFVPEDFERPLDLDALFPDGVAPLEVDLGCGDGAFLAARAGEYPARNFLGLERMIGRVRTSCRRISREQFTNARIIRVEIEHAVRSLFSADSVDVFHLRFPDPWPKRRHQPRRVFTAELLKSLMTALKPSGAFYIATDQRDYFAEMTRIVNANNFFERDEAAEQETLPQSTFEQRFLAVGEEIHRLALRKVPP